MVQRRTKDDVIPSEPTLQVLDAFPTATHGMLGYVQGEDRVYSFLANQRFATINGENLELQLDGVL